MIVDGDPNLGSTGERGYSGDKRRQTFLWTEVHVSAGPWVMVAD